MSSSLFSAFFLNWGCGNCCWKSTSQVFFDGVFSKMGFVEWGWVHFLFFFFWFSLNWGCGNCCWKSTSQVFFLWGVLKNGFCKVGMSSWSGGYYLSYNSSTQLIYVIFRSRPCLSHMEHTCIFLPIKVTYADTLLSFFWLHVIFLVFFYRL